ncbi:hypothetical protein LOK49_LG04G02973 [Camellia lanceoleosa]|uniref:Uncharacterized protein n=1 Tax=Camellia lanceoleosa TaxID=1840588 RepID=A0ACC0HZ27_9ERIC|nr:hypothetical protein LOK49_LG04G02973 [Camellia lanceoleosa]
MYAFFANPVDLVFLLIVTSGFAVSMVMKYANNIVKVKTLKPELVVVRNESLVDELKAALADVEDKPEIIPGEQGVIEVARHPDAVTVVTK